MLDIVEPRHIAAILSPFEWDDPAAPTSDLDFIASQLGILSGQPILVPFDQQPEFELASRRLLDEMV